ncbi:hypothetical protein OQA88_3759 [Cercophora sp. LCS_1]
MPVMHPDPLSNPSGSIKLVAHHCGKNGRWSTTTLIVLLYLVINLIGRLGVAAFGLTYDINDNVEVEYPVKLPNFGDDKFLGADGKIHTPLVQLNNFELAGLSSTPAMFDWLDPSSYTMADISGRGPD